MRSIVIREPGGPDVLTAMDRPDPEPGPRDILVRVAAVGVNRADLMQRRGHYPPPAGVAVDIPGLEFAGTVSRTGASVTRWRAGDRVMGLVGGGAYAELVCTHEDEAIAIPDGLSFEQAAAIPEAFITAHDALISQSRLRAGEIVLIHAVGSGVGTAAVQIAHAVGARVVGTARGRDKLDQAKKLGMDIGVDTTNGFAAGDVISAVGESAVNVVLELVGGDYTSTDIQVLARHGRLALVGLVAGSTATLDLRMILNKRLTIRGTVMRARSHTEKVDAARAFASFAQPFFADGTFAAVVDRTFDFADAAAAHRYLEANANFGKVVLVVPSGE